jgi:ABC-2 type transport system ATP-binding protein
MNDVIAATGLTKRFGSTTALDGLDLRVRAGEVHGFLGPNGAGKSTTLRALLGLVRLDAGDAAVLGHDPWRDTVALHRRVAYVPGEVTLWPNLTGGEAVDVLLRLRGVVPERSHRDDLLERFELDPTKRCRAYSKGNRQKLLLVAALATEVDLLLLDEPTAGLDPLMCETFAELVTQRVAGGATVLLSSHVLSEVEELADRVTIIRDGRCVETGTLAELRHLRATRVRAQLPGPAPQLEALRTLEGVHDVEVDGGRLTCTVDAVALAPLLAALSAAGVTELTSEPPSLEQVFLAAYRPAAPVGAP